MKTYALPRVDGGIEIMYTDSNPAACIAKWPAAKRAEITGEIKEIQPSDIPASREDRGAWKLNGTAVEVDK